MELTALDRAEQLERRKWIYEQKFPQTKKGGIPNQTENLSFSSDAAEKTGQTARTVRADVAIAKGIPAKIRDDIRGTDMEDSREDLRALARAKADPAALNHWRDIKLSLHTREGDAAVHINFIVCPIAL